MLAMGHCANVRARSNHDAPEHEPLYSCYNSLHQVQKNISLQPIDFFLHRIWLDLVIGKLIYLSKESLSCDKTAFCSGLHDLMCLVETGTIESVFPKNYMNLQFKELLDQAVADHERRSFETKFMNPSVATGRYIFRYSHTNCIFSHELLEQHVIEVSHGVAAAEQLQTSHRKTSINSNSAAVVSC